MLVQKGIDFGCGVQLSQDVIQSFFLNSPLFVPRSQLDPQRISQIGSIPLSCWYEINDGVDSKGQR